MNHSEPLTHTAHEALLKAAEPYMRVRKNDVHIPLSYEFAMKLADHYPKADREIVAAAILLHDIGWYSIDEKDIFEKGFGPNMMESDVRFLHEKEGVRLSAPLLQKMGYTDGFIEAVGFIIDGHDTRAFARSKEDEIVRDADKLWRFTVTGISVACDWFKTTPSGYYERLKSHSLKQLHLPESVMMAEQELQISAQRLKIGVL